MIKFWEGFRKLGNYELALEEPLKEYQRPAIPFSNNKPKSPVSCIVEIKPGAKEYLKAAEDIGFQSQELVGVKLRTVLHELDYPIFDRKIVAEYLQYHCEKAGFPRWCWRPLRPKDIINNFGWGNPNEHSGYYRAAEPACHPYHQNVPMEVLRKVKAIEDRMTGYPISFMVSDWEQKNLDPFIMVLYSGKSYAPWHDHLIFDFWDEPAFTKKIGNLI